MHVEKLQRLFLSTPESVVHFLSGSLPLTGYLNLRQLTLLGMISRLGPSNILHRHTVFVLSNPKENSRSWFCLRTHTCSQYSLPSPKEILDSQQSRSSFKSLIESKVHDFWEQKLREDASRLPSLKYFKPEYYSLAQPHPIWRFAGNNPYEVEKATVQARFQSGRYRTCWLSRRWTPRHLGHSSTFSSIVRICNRPGIGY